MTDKLFISRMENEYERSDIENFVLASADLSDSGRIMRAEYISNILSIKNICLELVMRNIRDNEMKINLFFEKKISRNNSG